MTVGSFVDGNDARVLILVNTADNFLHLGLTAAAPFAGSPRAG